ncbi:MAG: HAMP domain-containing protein [Gammaproteobacteria bacterium]|nr:HAMP domain-containing protein [Gammaproteobacteria bacterium]
MSGAQRRERGSVTRLFSAMQSRIFAALVAGILGSAALSFYLAHLDRERVLAEAQGTYLAEVVSHLVDLLEESPPQERAAQFKKLRRMGVRGELREDEALDGMPLPSLEALLKERLDPGYDARARLLPPERCPAAGRHAVMHPADPCFAVRLRLKDGEIVQVALRGRIQHLGPPPERPALSVYALLFFGCIAALAWAVARMVTRPLAGLARAARSLGENIEREPLAETGPAEVREASAAFNTMQARLKAHVAERTRMLAAITHDLQTPLTRLRLRLEQVDEAGLKDKLLGDLAQVQALITEGLELARGFDAGDPVQAVDLDALLDSLVADAVELGQAVSLAGRLDQPVQARPLGLRRALSNLLDNALNYGESAEIDVETQGNAVCIAIRDHGPGIPEAELERVFQPFVRLEASRSRHTGGTGLGLTIARAIAEQAGGRLDLANHPEGGLLASLYWPLPART